MNASNSGAVFFLGTRAHYQVLQQPDHAYDVENGNASTETIYQNSNAVNELWSNDKTDAQNNEVEYTGEHSNWGYSETPEVIVNDNKDTGVKRRAKRRPSETALCEEKDMRPGQLNDSPDSTPKAKGGRRRVSLLGALASLARRKRRLQSHSACYLKRLELALTTCTYRESCRCFECQSRYFECDEDEYSSEDDEYEYAAQYYASQMVNMNMCQHDEDDEIFVDTVPDDNTSTDMLLDDPKEKTQSVSSVSVSPEPEHDPALELEVAAGTPIVLNYLLTHPITCCIQNMASLRSGQMYGCGQEHEPSAPTSPHPARLFEKSPLHILAPLSYLAHLWWKQSHRYTSSLYILAHLWWKRSLN